LPKQWIHGRSPRPRTSIVVFTVRAGFRRCCDLESTPARDAPTRSDQPNRRNSVRDCCVAGARTLPPTIATPSGYAHLARRLASKLQLLSGTSFPRSFDMIDADGYAGGLAAAFDRACEARVDCSSRSSLTCATLRLPTTITGGKR
jgi:hypothetical protein